MAEDQQDQIVILIKGDLYPYTRTTFKKKFVDRYYQLYRASTADLRQQAHRIIVDQGWNMFPLGTPLRLGVILQVAKGLHKRDLSNQTKAIEDGLQSVALANDCWIDQSYGYRCLGDTDLCLVFIERLELAPPDDPEWITELHKVAQAVGIDG